MIKKILMGLGIAGKNRATARQRSCNCMKTPDMLRMCSSLRTSATLRGDFTPINDCPFINITKKYVDYDLF